MHPRSIRVVILTSVAILTIAVMAVFLVPRALASDAFPDVPDSHWAHDFIKWLSDNGITSGFPDGTYRPDNNVTRAEMAVFVQQVAGAGSAGPVTDADKLDGLDSSAFLQKGTRRLVVPGSAFFGDEETEDWSHWDYSGAVTCVTSCTVVAPVQLPHGATVTRVIWYYGSTAGGDAELHLESNDFAGGHDDMVSMFPAITVSRTLLRVLATTPLARHVGVFVPTSGGELPQLQTATSVAQRS